MNKYIACAMALVIGCAGYDGSDPSVDLGQNEQGLQVELDAAKTIGTVTSQTQFPRCTSLQSSASVCKILKPITLSTDGVAMGSPVRFQFAVSDAGASAPNWPSSWRPTVNTYLDQLTADLQAQFPGHAPPWSTARVASSQPFNVYVVRTSIPGTPAVGEKKWENYVRPSFGGCTTLTGANAPSGYPGTYQFCNNLTCDIDFIDLQNSSNDPNGSQDFFAQNQITWDANNLGQAIRRCVRYAIGIENGTTAQRDLQPGAVMQTVGLTTGDKRALNFYANPVDGLTWTYLWFSDFF